MTSLFFNKLVTSRLEMLIKILLFSIVIVIVNCDHYLNETIESECPNVKTELPSIRKRRHLAFTPGSNVVLTISLVKAFMTHAPAGWNIAIEIDVAFPLPDEKFVAAHSRKKLHHRQKREWWERIREALELHNINGHSCVLRSICDTKRLAPMGHSLVHDIFRAIFTAPLHTEPHMEEYEDSFEELKDPDFCDKVQDCPFSLLNFILDLNKQY